MFNFIVFIFCTAMAIYDFYIGWVGWGLTQTAMALINLPFAIKWLMTMI